jgi:hypothetical protein
MAPPPETKPNPLIALFRRCVVGVTDEAGRGSGFFVAPGQFCDPWVQDRHALIEANNSDSKERPRMAMGQLYD